MLYTHLYEIYGCLITIPIVVYLGMTVKATGARNLIPRPEYQIFEIPPASKSPFFRRKRSMAPAAWLEDFAPGFPPLKESAGGNPWLQPFTPAFSPGAKEENGSIRRE